MKKVRTRFAPSPTGRMHVGNLRTALYAYLIAKHEGGDFMLRIEDTDQERYVEGALDIIYRTLEKTGLVHDEGPDKDGGVGPYVQSERQASGIYMKYAKQLIEQGDAYYCFCDKERLESLKTSVSEDGTQIVNYDKHCLHLSKEEIEANLAAGKPYVVRINMPTEGTTTFHDEIYGDITVPNAELDDMILIKSDGYPTYNFANVIDDHLMNISHVVRGNEYLSSTPKYNLIYKTFDWEIPTYIHLPPVNKDETHKLSKRNGDASYQDLKEKGYLKEAIINYIALLGWSPADEEILSLDDLIAQFNIEHISKSPAIFDIDKLNWMNGMYLREMPLNQFHELLLPYYHSITRKVDLLELSKVLQPRLEKLSDVEESIDFINQAHPFDASIYTHKKMKTNPENSLEALELVKERIADFDDFNNDEAMTEFFVNLAKEKELKNGRIMWPVRVALTNKSFTPGGAVEIAHILGKEETSRRIDQAIIDLQNVIQ